MTNWLLSLVFLFYLATQMSQSAMDFFATLIFGTYLLFGLKEHFKVFLSSHRMLFLGLSIWVLSIAIGIGVSAQNLSLSHWSQLTGFIWILQLLSFSWLIERLKQPEKLERWLLLAFSVTSAYAILISILGFDPLDPGRTLDLISNGQVRTGGFLAQPIVYAHLMVISLTCIAVTPLSFYQMGRLQDLGRRLWYFVALGLGIGALTLSFTRGAWLSLIAALLVSSYLLNKQLFKKIFLGTSAILLLLFFIWPSFHERLVYAVQGGDHERISIWKANLLMFWDHPIFGVGLGENVNRLAEYYLRVDAPPGLIISHAHNQYLNWLSSTGLLGLAGYLFFVILMTKEAQKNFLFFNKSWPKALALSSLAVQITLLVGGLTEANFVHSKIRYALLMSWALILNQSALRQKNQLP